MHDMLPAHNTIVFNLAVINVSELPRGKFKTPFISLLMGHTIIQCESICEIIKKIILFLVLSLDKLALSSTGI